MYVSRYFF